MPAVPLVGSERTLLADSTLLGRPDPRRRARVTILVRPSSTGDDTAQAYVRALVSQPPRARRHLSRTEFAERFGASDSDFRTVRAFAREYGLRVVEDFAVRQTDASQRAHRTLELEGTLADLRRAFKVDFVRARDADGTVYRTYHGRVSIPEPYAAVIQNVFGLDTRPQAQPRLARLRSHSGYEPNLADTGFTPDRVAQLYNFPKGADGNGQTIALIELGGGFRRHDLQRYFEKLGIAPPHVTIVEIGRGANAPVGSPDSDDAEVMLDIEVAAAIAPSASIVVYFARNTNRGFYRAVSTAIHDQKHAPSILSISWGGPESTWTSLDATSMDAAFQAAAAVGMSVFVASGDAGSSDGLDDGHAHVDFPASSPFVTACGGTRLDVSGNAVVKEAVWNDAMAGGTGGGISALFPLPPYQTGPAIHLPAPLDGAPGRGVPDVSGNADPATGYKVRIDGVTTILGGTSAVAPLWSGLFARINQQLGAPVGFVNTLLYSVVASTPGALRDVTDGTNDTTGTLGGYAAGPGWDACTGLGSPADGTKILSALQTI